MTFDRSVQASARASSTGTTYEAGSHARRTFGWNAPTVSPNQAILANLTTLRDRSRAAVRNDGFAKGIVETLVSALIGTGIQPLSKAVDAGLRERIQAQWLAWTWESDADGLLDQEGQQTQATRAWLEGGECFVILRPRLPQDGLTVPLQLQIVEPELCPHTYALRLPSGNVVRGGIERTAIGRRVAFWFHPSRPDPSYDWDLSRLVRLEADRVIHVFDPLRPGQVRGIPVLTQGLQTLHTLDKFDDATLLRQQLANLFVAFIKKPASNADPTVDPLTGLPIDTTRATPTLTLEPGIFQELQPGEELEFSDPPEIRSGYTDFMRQQLRDACTAAGVPYAIVTGDMTGINDRLVRVILNEFRRRVQALQHQVLAFQFCRRVWRAWFDRAVFSGALPIAYDVYRANPAQYDAVKWMPQGWPYLHPVQDVQAKVLEITGGLTSRSAAVSERGDDAEAIDTEQASDNERAARLGLSYETRTTAAAAEPEPDPEPEPQEEGAIA